MTTKQSWDGVIILISGKASAGKDTLANYLSTALNCMNRTTIVAAFADPLKDICRNHFGWNGTKDAKGRQLLIDIGRSACKYDKYIWARRLDEKYMTTGVLYTPVIIVSDWRLMHELEYMKSKYKHIITVRTNRKNHIEHSNHPIPDDNTEVELDNYQFDYYVENVDFTYQQFEECVNNIAKHVDRLIDY